MGKFIIVIASNSVILLCLDVVIIGTLVLLLKRCLVTKFDKNHLVSFTSDLKLFSTSYTLLSHLVAERRKINSPSMMSRPDVNY